MARKTIALAMMVHNEAHILPFLFEQIGDRMDSAAIIVHPEYDDNSAEVVKELCEKYNLKYRIEQWDHPDNPPHGANSRNQVLDMAREFDEDYVLWLDPDDPLVGTIPDELEYPIYNFEVVAAGTSWCVEHLIARECKDVQWKGAIHESLTVTGYVGKLLEECHIQRANGSGGGPERMKEWDLPVLLAECEKDPNDGHAWYYLAQTYRDLNMWPEAVAAFNHRAEMGGLQSLVYWCRFQVAEITLNPDDYLIAYNAHPKRVEALHRLAAIYNSKQQYNAARLFAYIGLRMPPTEDAGFVERWVEEYGLLAELAVAEYYGGDKDKAYQAFEYILGLPNVREVHRAVFQNNFDEMKKERRKAARPKHNGRVTPKKKTVAA